MSLVNTTSRPSAPQFSLFGDIARVGLGAVGGFLTGGPVGAVAGGAAALSGVVAGGASPGGGGATGPGSTGNVAFPTPTVPMIQPRVATPGFGGFGAGGGFSGGGAGGQFGLPTPTGGATVPNPMVGTGMVAAPRQQPTVSQMTATGMAGACMQCPPGFRPNKSDYFLMSGEYVPVKSRCVKIRRRNPLNPRALSRSIARVKSAKNAAKMLSNVTIRQPQRR